MPATAFNRMASDLAGMERERAMVLAGISHDLRTPLSRLRLMLEMSGAESTASEAMITDIDEIDAVIGQFLDFARSETGDKSENDLNELLDDLAGHYARLGRKVSFRHQPMPTFAFARMAVRRAGANLVDNPLRDSKALERLVAAGDRADQQELLHRPLDARQPGKLPGLARLAHQRDVRGERSPLQDEFLQVELHLQIFGELQQFRRRGVRSRPDDAVVFPMGCLLNGKRVRLPSYSARAGDGLFRLRFAEKRERQMDLFLCGGAAARLQRRLARPVRQRARGPGRPPDGEEQAHYYSAKGLRINSANARSAESADLCSAAATSSCSRRPRFCDSFQRVSSRVTAISKLTIPSSMLSTYSRRRASNFGSHCGSSAVTSRRCDACFAFRS